MRKREFSETDRLLPTTFKVGRDYELQGINIEEQLYTKIHKKGIGKITIGEKEISISKNDIQGYLCAIEQTLFNQSYLSKAQINTGVSKGRVNKELSKFGVENNNNGVIWATIYELCQIAYGVEKPTTEQKERMKATIEAVASTFVFVEYRNKDGKCYMTELPIALVLAKTKDKEVKFSPDVYTIQINPILCYFSQGYGVLPQNVVNLLSTSAQSKGLRRTEAYLRMTKFLALQKGSCIKRKELTLLCDLGLQQHIASRNINKARKLLTDIFSVLVEIGQLSKMPTTETDNTGETIYVFSINSDFPKDNEEK